MFSKVIYMSWALVCVLAAPPTDVVPLEKEQPTVIPILSQSEELEPNGTYKYSFETGNGIKREEISFDKVVPKVEGRSAASSNEGGESNESNEIHVQQGSYSYTAPDGTVISLRYIADENGFQPIGDHLPKAPALLSALQASHDSSERSSRKLDDSAGSGSAPAPSSSAPEKPQRFIESSSSEAVSTTEAGKVNEAKSSEESNVTEAIKSSEEPNVTEAAKASEFSEVTTGTPSVEVSTKADSAEVVSTSTTSPEAPTASSSEVTSEAATTTTA